MKWFHLEIFLNNTLRLQSISIFIIYFGWLLVVMGKRIRLLRIGIHKRNTKSPGSLPLLRAELHKSERKRFKQGIVRKQDCMHVK